MMFEVDIDPDFLLYLSPCDGFNYIIASDISFISLEDLVLNLDCQPITHADHPWPLWSGFLKTESWPYDLVWLD